MNLDLGLLHPGIMVQKGLEKKDKFDLEIKIKR